MGRNIRGIGSSGRPIDCIRIATSSRGQTTTCPPERAPGYAHLNRMTGEQILIVVVPRPATIRVQVNRTRLDTVDKLLSVHRSRTVLRIVGVGIRPHVVVASQKVVCDLLPTTGFGLTGPGQVLDSCRKEFFWSREYLILLLRTQANCDTAARRNFNIRLPPL